MHMYRNETITLFLCVYNKILTTAFIVVLVQGYVWCFLSVRVSGHVCLPPLLLSLAYPGAYPPEKTDELVKAV